MYVFTDYDNRGPEEDQDPSKHVASVNNLITILKIDVVLSVSIPLYIYITQLYIYITQLYIYITQLYIYITQLYIYITQLYIYITQLEAGQTPEGHPWLISNLTHKILIYLHIIHLLKSSTCFEHYPAHLQEVYVVIVYMLPLALS